MRLLQLASWAILAAVMGGASADTDVVFVTDISIYTLLAPCAASAIADNVGAMTYSTMCADGDSELQSCVCSNTKISLSVSSEISSEISWGCGPKATDDFSSASEFMELYCNQQETGITFATPTTNIVNEYITDLPQITYLAPCAQTALSDAVMGWGYDRCPEAAQLFAPCVCSKEYLMSSISESLTASVKAYCSNSEDVTAADQFYNEYCAMNSGTTSFASPSGPPGDMTYYITALSQFKSMRKCAQTGMSSAIMQQSSFRCPNGPQALASCACIKSGMFNYVSSMVTEGVKDYCDSTATADLSSAISLWDLYCSAAEDKVVLTVSQSIAQASATATSGPSTAVASQTQESSSSATATGAASSGDESDNGSSRHSTSSSNTGAIAGGVVAGVAVVVIALLAFFLIRRRRNKKNGEQLPSSGDGTKPPDYGGKPELMGSDPTSPATNASFSPFPVSAVTATGDDGLKTELPSNHPPTPELQGGVGYAVPYGQAPPQELGGAGYGHQQPQLHGQPVQELAGKQGGMGWQSGPVEAYELDSNVGHRQA